MAEQRPVLPAAPVAAAPPPPAPPAPPAPPVVQAAQVAPIAGQAAQADVQVPNLEVNTRLYFLFYSLFRSCSRRASSSQRRLVGYQFPTLGYQNCNIYLGRL